MLYKGTLLFAGSLLLAQADAYIVGMQPAYSQLKRAHIVAVDQANLDQAEAKLALSYFIDDPDAKITPTKGGVNNYVQYVDTTKGERFVLRMYNNGGNTDRVKYEHSVLDQLHKTGVDSLPFKVPTYVPSFKTGSTMIELPSGNQACVCLNIPGTLPKNNDPRLLGAAVGQLLGAMGKLDVKLFQGKSAPPYADIYRAHPACDRDKFYKYVSGTELDVCREAMNALIEEFKPCDKFADENAKKLPMQPIHGDLHYDNVLCDAKTGAVTGLLDFEFCAVDWRAMDPAVTLSKYVGEADPFPLVKSFIEGFSEHSKLTQAEIYALPDMINLRVMSNVVYFVGRAISGEDGAISPRSALHLPSICPPSALPTSQTACSALLASLRHQRADDARRYLCEAHEGGAREPDEDRRVRGRVHGRGVPRRHADG